LAIAKWIFPHKQTLFGKHSYSAGVTNSSKKAIWEEIHYKAQAAGFPVLDVNHTRDVSACCFTLN
jgi:hypothetical protein